MDFETVSMAPSAPPKGRRRLGLVVLGASWMLILYAGAYGSAGADELAVIVNPDCGVVELSRDQIINIFLGRQRRLPDGTPALAVDLDGQGNEKARFYERLVDKKLAEINSYWARLVFSGRGSPPWQAETAEEVLTIVSDHRGAISYIERSRVDAGVRIVHTLPD